jgi:alkanesulfonate monooxygenase SsuD/methylene tetrahydromethanopterin reductase-like flavin-dependent oxidoreductase (luciferase family)
MNMGMKIGASPTRGADIGEWQQRLREAEEQGYAFFATGDTFASMLLAAQATEHALVGPTVTVPTTRNPLVMAAEASVVDRACDGRLALWIGRGFSSVLSIGERIETTEGMREYIVAVQQLLAGETAHWQGKELTVGSPVRVVPRNVRIIVSAYGPKTMRMAGATATGVGIASAASPELMRRAIATVREGAEAAGRDPDSVEIWAMVRASVRDTYEEALGDLKANLASGIQHVAKNDPGVPEALKPRIEELRRRYMTAQHVQPNGPNEVLLDELGLSDYAADRLAICGTPEQCRERILGLADAGVDYLYFAAATRDPEAMMQRMATEVVPELLAER